MPAWIPVLKAVLPPLANIISSAAPVFSARGNGANAQQIIELQQAVGNNAANVIELADKLKTTVEAMEAEARSRERALRQLRVICGLALTCACASLLLSLALIVRN